MHRGLRLRLDNQSINYEIKIKLWIRNKVHLTNHTITTKLEVYAFDYLNNIMLGYLLYEVWPTNL